MGFIDDELQEVSKLCHNVVDGSRLVSCVPSMVRVEITKTVFKQLVVCIQFREDYPASPLFIELKSKTLSTKLLDRLANVCEKECKLLINKAQILPILKFIRSYIEENPLICCYDEISALKKLVGNKDELKLKQKNSSITLTLHQDLYYFKTRLEVPDNYPISCVVLSDVDTNFPPLFKRYLIGQGKEFARQCVESPLKKTAAQQKPFAPLPSLNKNCKSFSARTLSTLQSDVLACKSRRDCNRRKCRSACREALLWSSFPPEMSRNIHEDSAIPWR
ncbi:uncharacterized protein LOC109851637 isoform X2 [Pseudomyrmex gracilis]|uniref:uncharacterized protein LOC109851637 isoform X2 n=1 Tax=Pseudomyrmex gracilis TaxID=219809 RepID=UPI0009950A2B|nr:uncharacterized protein LOC109851637 isoform X2 [Pseudomyrmex gracilis]